MTRFESMVDLLWDASLMVEDRAAYLAKALYPFRKEYYHDDWGYLCEVYAFGEEEIEITYDGTSVREWGVIERET